MAVHDGRLAGALSYEVRDGEMEVVTIDAFQRCLGIGTALLGAAAEEARRRGCSRLWLITTNDNTPALVDTQRILKPEIPAKLVEST